MSRLMKKDTNMPKTTLTAMDCNVSPARRGEPTVFGADAPGGGLIIDTSEAATMQWVDVMRARGIRRVCCLLDERQLDRWDEFELLALFGREFGEDRVLHAPIQDYQTCSPDLFLGRILPFLSAAERAGDRAVVHCMAGRGRTGQVLAAWLIAARGSSPKSAVDDVASAGAWRDPLQATDRKGPEFLATVAAAHPPK
jgi:protein-tyrosine phosphatase